MEEESGFLLEGVTPRPTFRPALDPEKRTTWARWKECLDEASAPDDCVGDEQGAVIGAQSGIAHGYT